ncbi:unnamed protein product [Notodromas monacha]|uniref:Uncharacterized protein n=1 Tax=Notodromas monacha TaxID=399045 RepID=A0A7R9GFN5_9CRUS|nr:unnamed protein product [Notodromas monacha]CAG0920956.1 unnamed protein product [Notodromas monacha]
MVKLTMSSASTSTMTEMQTSVTSTSSCPQFESAVVGNLSTTPGSSADGSSCMMAVEVAGAAQTVRTFNATRKVENDLPITEDSLDVFFRLLSCNENVPYGSSTSSNNGPPSFLSFSSGSTNYANSGNYKKDKALNEYQRQTSGHQHSEKGQDASNGFGGPPKDPRYNRPNKHHYEATIVDPFEAFQNIMGSSGPTLTWPAGVSDNQESRTRMSQIVRTANNFIRQFPLDEDTVRNAARWGHGRQRMDLHPPDRVINSFATNFEIYIAIARMRNLQLLQRTTPELVEQLLDKLKKRMSSDALLRFGNPMETS